MSLSVSPSLFLFQITSCHSKSFKTLLNVYNKTRYKKLCFCWRMMHSPFNHDNIHNKPHSTNSFKTLHSEKKQVTTFWIVHSKRLIHSGRVQVSCWMRNGILVYYGSEFSNSLWVSHWLINSTDLFKKHWFIHDFICLFYFTGFLHSRMFPETIMFLLSQIYCFLKDFLTA